MSTAILTLIAMILYIKARRPRPAISYRSLPSPPDDPLPTVRVLGTRAAVQDYVQTCISQLITKLKMLFLYIYTR